MKQENQKPEKSQRSQKEEEILLFWNENSIFQKTLDKESPKGEFIFYDGPPFATGLPHPGHMLQGTIKDVIPRYKTMQGYNVPRQWGWDCHGLPIENLVEKELGFKTKQDILDHGIGKFNEYARNSVLRYEEQWKKFVPRSGRFIDMENSYKSMDSSYSESVWWSFKTMFDKDLIYEGFKAMHLCPRCETTLSNFEVNQGYEDVKDISVTAKFPLVGDENTVLLAWTTTPWTLPGNVALAIGRDFLYSKISIKDEEGDVIYLTAKDLVEKVFEGKEYEVVGEVKGSDLEGLSYVPAYDGYQKDESLINRENGWSIISADFVTVEDGTGIVHIAPAYGGDDLELGKKLELPFIQHVSKSGILDENIPAIGGLLVKKKDDHMSTDIEVIKWMAGTGKLFSKKKLIHSYPHCWRCSTPLLNYATGSWFLKVTDLKSRLIEENSKISWIPEHIKEGRMGNWLEGARDWAISRSRFWGAALPVWKHPKTGEITVLGSFSELRENTKRSGNNYIFMRHGQAQSNLDKLLTSDIKTEDHLTKDGESQAHKAAKDLAGKGITKIYHSPFYRTTETAKIIQKELGLSDDQMISDDRLVEIAAGELDRKPYKTHDSYFDNPKKFHNDIPGGESLSDVRRRVGEFLYEIESKDENEVILILSHGTPLWMLDTVVFGWNEKESMESKPRYENATWYDIDFVPLPHTDQYEFDVHRPYIDNLEVVDKSGDKLDLIGDVFDVWYESGSMPYASIHYPFENKEKFENTLYPADFIAEGIDQTRGWFYVLQVLGVALFDKSPYRNVMCTGMILAESGKKMSKSLQNYMPISDIFDTYGADALRLFLIDSPVVRGQEVKFSPKGMKEVQSKTIGRMLNTLSFYLMNKKDERNINPLESTSVLDLWMITRLSSFIEMTARGFENYEIDRAAREFAPFVDDLSTWFVRRSRDVLKMDNGDGKYARATLLYVLKNAAKVFAPVVPFVSEEIWQELRDEHEEQSVHLCDWPEVVYPENYEAVFANMKTVREMVTMILEKRVSENLKVRQPLAGATIPSDLDPEYLQIIQEEVNVREVFVDKGKENVWIDTTLTEDLKIAGFVRELLRAIQAKRKSLKLVPEDKIKVKLSVSAEKIIKPFEDDISSKAGVASFEYKNENEGDKISLHTFESTMEVIVF